jgi:hypothetical protein
MIKLNLDEMRARADHVMELCRKHDISLFFSDEIVKPAGWRNIHGYAYPAKHQRWIRVMRYWGPLSYMTALHEIGHVMLGGRKDHTPQTVVANEEAAWKWAFEHAKFAPPYAERFRRFCLGNYTLSYGLRPEYRAFRDYVELRNRKDE